MQSTDEWIKTCIKKKRYSTEDFADTVIKKVLQERGTQLHRYYCPHCFGWHLTKKIRVEILYEEKLSRVMSETNALKEELLKKESEIKSLKDKLSKNGTTDKIDKDELKRLRAISYNKQLLDDNLKLRQANNRLKKDNGELIAKIACRK